MNNQDDDNGWILLSDTEDDKQAASFVDGNFEVMVNNFYVPRLCIDYGGYPNSFTFQINTQYGIRNITIEKTRDNLNITTNSKQLYNGAAMLKKNAPNLVKLNCNRYITILVRSKYCVHMEILVRWPYRNNEIRRINYLKFLHQIKKNNFDKTSKKSMFLSASVSAKFYWKHHISSFL